MNREYRIYYRVSYGRSIILTGISLSERTCEDPYIFVKETDGVMVLPERINGVDVESIDDFCFMGLCGKEDDYHDISVVDLIVPTSYRRLGKKNFSQWNSLKYVTLYCDANALCQWNFAYCDALCEVRCPCDRMFDFCMNLPESISDDTYGCFDGCMKNIRFMPGFRTGEMDFHSFALSIAEEIKGKLMTWMGANRHLSFQECHYLKRSGFPFELPSGFFVGCNISEIGISPLIHYLDRYEHRYAEAIFNPLQLKELRANILSETWEYVLDTARLSG